MAQARLFSVFNATRRQGVADQVSRADGFLSRAVGLLGTSGLEPGQGLWIEPCAQIHTFFMAFPIDAVFLDGGRRVVRVLEGLVPWRMSPWVRGARSVVELRSHETRGRVFPGDVLEIDERERA